MENTQAQLPWEWCYVQGQAPLLVLPAPDLDKDLTNCVQYTLSAKPPRISAKKKESAENSGPQRTSRDHGEWIKFSGRR